MHVRPIGGYLIGGAAALLLARMTLRLLAARPDNPFVRLYLDLTAPLVAPLAFLDAGQPRYGAVLELSTLALFMLLVVAILALARLSRRAGSATE